MIRRSGRVRNKPAMYKASDLDDALEKRTVNNKSRKRAKRKRSRFEIARSKKTFGKVNIGWKRWRIFCSAYHTDETER